MEPLVPSLPVCDWPAFRSCLFSLEIVSPYLSKDNLNAWIPVSFTFSRFCLCGYTSLSPESSCYPSLLAHPCHPPNTLIFLLKKKKSWPLFPPAITLSSPFTWDLELLFPPLTGICLSAHLVRLPSPSLQSHYHQGTCGLCIARFGGCCNVLIWYDLTVAWSQPPLRKSHLRTHNSVSLFSLLSHEAFLKPICWLFHSPGQSANVLSLYI